jgi:outer membrane protein assembly factor BamE
MRMLPLYSRFLPPLTASAPMLLSLALIAGCASKNPLIDEPVAESKSPAPQPAAPTAPVQAQTSAPVQTAEAKPAAAPATTGVQTTRQRRFLGIFSPYRPDIQQGNFVSREMVAQLKEGMTREQVRFVLGTPLLTDIFHAERWDYPFRLREGNGEVTSSRVTVFFKDNRLARIEGGDLPTEKEFLTLIAGSAPAPAPQADSAPAPVPATQQTPSSEADQTINRER